MKTGKLPNEVLEKIVIRNISHKREDVLVRSKIGEDCAVIDFGEEVCVVSSDPITGANDEVGMLAVNISCNDIASNGAEPVGVVMTILAPEETTEDEIEAVMKGAAEESKKLNVEIVGGHTEITNAVNKIVVMTTVIGRQKKEDVLKSEEVEFGDVVLITKNAGIEGTAIIANEKKQELSKSMSEESINKAIKMFEEVSVVKDGMICAKNGAKYMHDVTEGGLLGGVWEASKAIEKGIKIFDENIKLREETINVCKHFEIDPLKLISSGCMLVIASKEDSNKIKTELKKENIEAFEIGIIEGSSIIMSKSGREEEIESPGSDELYKVIE